MRSRCFMALAVAAWAVSCQAAQPPASTPTPTLAPAVSATSTPGPTAAPTPTRASSPSASPFDPCAGSTEASPKLPPDLLLAVGNEPGVEGELGSFSYCDTAADALPPRAEDVDPVSLGPAPVVTLRVREGERVGSFRAVYWDAAEWQGDPINLAGDEPDAPRGSFAFDGPRAGDWMLAVGVTFPSGGDATYYWHVTVP